ncbi:very-short-patch-repair endonuclease [Elusimicrobium simillimum]|uniref:endonuclease domain-containing protein n=1 Tax=Elusimicrobium simillimum TaxID=3143438 RepID=UPI003C7044A9
MGESEFISNIIKYNRRNMTPAERKLWNMLKAAQTGHKFRRQHLIKKYNYIADFICIEKRLILEIDGGQHCENIKDKQRDLNLKLENYKVLRFWNNEVLKNPEAVYEVILNQLR